MWSIQQIEDFIYASGSDHVPTFGGKYEGGIQCQQIADEIAPCFHYLLSNGPIKDYLEVGVAAGGTTYAVAKILKPERIVLVDDNRHPKAHVRPYILDGIERKEIIGDSHNPDTVKRVRGQFDVLFIDGDHSYVGAKADFENFFPLVRAGGHIILHDTAVPTIGVMQLFNELKTDPRVEFTAEYLTEKQDNPCGVGVFKKCE